MLSPEAELPTDRSREELHRRIHWRHAEQAAHLSGAPTPRAADLDGYELGEVLARGVGRSITSDGLEWLLRRHHLGAMAPLAALQPTPHPSPGSDASDPASGAWADR